MDFSVCTRGFETRHKKGEVQFYYGKEILKNSWLQ
jgi:hypothetical protein